MKAFALGLILIGSMSWAQVPQSKHVWIVAEENHSYEAVIGNPGMPYFNSLAKKYGLATQYYSEQHNSISALMWLVAGQPITGNNQTTSCYNMDNVARHLIAQGYDWRSYQEDLPYPGFAGISYANYVRRHNPIVDFTDTCAAGQKDNSVPFTELAKDIANHTTPNYAYVTPNLLDDAHNGTLAAADYWLSQHLPAILALPEFKPGGDGILFVVFDEADLSSDGVTEDNRCASNISNGCGGRLATLVIGPAVKPHYKSSLRYDHANLLATVCAAMDFASCPGAGAVANPMADFFNTVNISTPFPDAKVSSPVHIEATSTNAAAIVATQLYVDNALKYQVKSGIVNTKLAMSLGQHFLVAQSWDAAGGIEKRGMNVSVVPEAVVVSNPAPKTVVGPQVQVGAAAGGQQPVEKMQLYVDGDSKYQSSGSKLNASLSLPAGNHTLAVEASDSSGKLFTNQFSVTSATPAMHILSPAANASFYAPMYVSAKTVDPTLVTTIKIFVDKALVYQVSGTGVQASLPISLGKHSVMVQATNKSGVTYSKAISINVVAVPITFSSPTANATVSSPVTVKASAPSTSTVQTMQIYVDNALAFQAAGQSVTHAFSLSAGRHYVVAKGWDQYGNSWYKGENISVK